MKKKKNYGLVGASIYVFFGDLCLVVIENITDFILALYSKVLIRGKMHVEMAGTSL